MASTVGVKQVAEAAEVSIGTVSRVFNNHSDVNEQLRERVLKAAAQLGYTGPSKQANRVQSSNKSLKEVAFYLFGGAGENVTVNLFWSQILHGAEREATRNDIKLSYRFIDIATQITQADLNFLYNMDAGGVLLVGQSSQETIKTVKQLGIPFVVVDNYVPGLNIDAVLSNNFEGARQAVNFLIQKGHRRIAFVGGVPKVGEERRAGIYSIDRRFDGYRTALIEAGIEFDPSLYVASPLGAGGGYRAGQQLLESQLDFSAVFCANDSTARGVIQALQEAGQRVPENVSVMGFDDEISYDPGHSLTTMRVNQEGIGSVAINTLLARVANPATPNVTITLDVELVERKSVKRLK